MPKEIIFGSEKPYADFSSAQSVLEVHWSRDFYVQVATRLFNDDFRYATVDGVVREAEGEERKRREVWGDGFFVNLDRRGINDLIRHLRRARDQAFGKDE